MISAEIASLCREGIANIEITPQGLLAASAPTLQGLAHEYCRARKLRNRGVPDEVRRLLRDGLRKFNATHENIDYSFVSRLSFGPRPEAKAPIPVAQPRAIGEGQADRPDDASGNGQEPDSWAVPFSAYITDYAIFLVDTTLLAKKDRRRFRWLLSVGSALLLISLFHVRLPGFLSWPGVFLRFFSGAGAVVCAYLFTRYRYVRELDSSSIHRVLGREIVLLPNRSALSLQIRAGTIRPVEPLEAEIFALALTNPAVLRQRITERYEPERRTLWHRVTAEIQIPGQLIAPPAGADARQPVSYAAADEKEVKDDVSRRKEKFEDLGRIPFPVIIPPKGELNDEIVVLGTDGERIPCFSYSEYLLVIASILRMLLLKAYRLANVDHLPKDGSEAERQALRCIMQRGTPSDDDVKSAVDGMMNLPRAPKGDTEGTLEGESHAIRDVQALRVAAELVRKLSGRYAIVASIECTPEGRMVLEYQRKMVPTLELGINKKGERFRWLQDCGSILLGARPVDLTLPLENASICQSFHLYVDCPEGLYLRRQRLSGLDEYLNRDNRQMSTIPPYYRLRRRLGQPYAHFYARFFPEPNEGEVLPEFRVSFCEVPPGSLFRAAVVAVSTALLVWLVGWVLARVQNPATDVPAVLLAFPAVAAAWLGFDEKRRRLLEGTLVSRVSLMLSAMTALGASALFMLNSAHLPVLHDRIPFPFDVSFLGLNQGSWGILAAVSLANSLGVGYLCLLRTWEFGHLASRPDPMSPVRER